MARGRAAKDAESARTYRIEAPGLRWTFDPDQLSFRSTREVPPVAGIVGQQTAADALEFGLQTNAPGQHIFVRGPAGTGRVSLVKEMLKHLRLTCPLAHDRCYVHNFTQPDRPRLIVLPRGQGKDFRRKTDRLVDFIRDDLRTALASEGIQALRTAADDTAKKRLRELVSPFEQKLKEVGLTLMSVEAGPVIQATIFPLVDGRPVPPDEFDRLHVTGEIADADYKSVIDDIGKLEPQLRSISEKANDIRQAHDEAVERIQEQAARSVLTKLREDLERDFPQPQVRRFLDDVTDDVLKYRLEPREEEFDFTRLYRVNVVLEHEPDDGCPVIVEDSPSVRNLRGTVDLDFEAGDEPRPSHMGIRAGSLLRADGGYLILEDRDILADVKAWRVLMRTLRTGRLEIAPTESPTAPWGLKPEPIDINVKVVLLGDDMSYALLDAFDHDFPELFKVLADFDTTMPRNLDSVNHYAAVISRLVKQEELPHFDRTAIAALAEHGARIAAQDDKITARFGRLADIAREAAFIANQDSRDLVSGDDIRMAVRRGKERGNLPSKKFRKLVKDGTIRVETSGTAIGQINGLAVLHAGPMVYGFPTRITATIGPGTAGVINIEREAALSGAIHTKGFYILGGLLRHLLQTDHPLAFDASIAFEQSYGGIDGDSASGAEICCLLSALTGVPLRQDLAMTGAIDQMGNVMPVGAINEKIEGFFDVCDDRALSGTQGVIIPRSNAPELMLKHAMLDDCRSGKFSVYAVDSVHEALEILTGMPAGAAQPAGTYAKNTLLALAVDKAEEFWLKAARPGADRIAKLKNARKPVSATAARKKKTTGPGRRKTGR